MTDLSKSTEAEPVPESGERRRPWLAERLAKRASAQTGVSAVYGAPVESAGVTVIPVARLRWRIGGGGSRGEGGGEGAGGSVTVAPLGYIELREGQSEFKKIKNPGSPAILAPILLAGGVGLMLVLRGVRRLYAT